MYKKSCMGVQFLLLHDFYIFEKILFVQFPHLSPQILKNPVRKFKNYVNFPKIT